MSVSMSRFFASVFRTADTMLACLKWGFWAFSLSYGEIGLALNEFLSPRWNKVAHSRISDARVWKRACDYLGLMNEPAICLSVLGPSVPSSGSVQKAWTIN